LWAIPGRLAKTTLRLAAAEEGAAARARAGAQCRVPRLGINLMDTSFLIGRERVRPGARRTFFWRWRDRLFILLPNLALGATEFFRIPPIRAVAFGAQFEI
jgi:K+ transporter